MIVLDSTLKSLEILLGGAVTTNQLPFVSSYVDISQSTFAVTGSSENDGQSNDTTVVTVVAAPAGSTTRKLNLLSVFNADTVSAKVTVQVNNNGTKRICWQGLLSVGDTLQYIDERGFFVTDSNGGIKAGGTTGPTGAIGPIGLGGILDGLDGEPGPIGPPGQVVVPTQNVLVGAVVVLTDGATPALNAALGFTFTLSAAGDRTIAVPTNPTSGQKIVIEHLASGGNRQLALNTGAGGFRFGSDITALTLTASGKTDYIGCIYNAGSSTWDVVAVTKGF